MSETATTPPEEPPALQPAAAPTAAARKRFWPHLAGATGRRLAKWSTFWVIFVLAFVASEWVCRSRNFLLFYPGGQRFPVMLDSMPGAGPDVRRTIALAALPVNRGSAPGQPSPYLLPARNPDPGVFQGNFVDYAVEPLGEGRIRVTLRRRADTTVVSWRKAVYEATADKITPLFIDGGSRASSPYWSALAALLAALVARRVGQGLVHAARAPGWRRAWRRLGVARWHEDPASLLVIAPFFYYASVVSMLTPDNWADSYAYLWRRTLNWYFLTGRCLTQRAVYSLACGSNLRVISMVQVLAYGAAALALYAGLRRMGGPMRRLAVAAFLLFLFSSYTLNVSAVAIASEPLFLALAVSFPAVLFFWRRRWWAAASLAVGIPFVFSKNVSPFLAVGLVILHLLMERIVVRRRGRRGAWAVYTVLAALSVGAVVASQRYDESLDMNTFNNLCQRILTSPDTTKLFHDKYGLPEGAYAAQLRGRNSNSSLDGKPLYSVSTETMNFVMTTDRYGVMEWVRTKGRRAYLRYLLLDRPAATWREFRRGFAVEARSRSLAYLRGALDLRLTDGGRTVFPDQVPSRMRNSDVLATLQSGGATRPLGSDPPDSFQRALRRIGLGGMQPGGTTGFFGFDSLELLQRALTRIGFGSVRPILLYCVAGLVLLGFLRRRALLEPAIAYLAVGLAYFFLSFFGDSPAEERHLFPAFVLTEIGASLYLYSLAEIAGCALWRLRPWRNGVAQSRRDDR